MLFDAMERFEDGDVKADDNLRSIFDLDGNNSDTKNSSSSGGSSGGGSGSGSGGGNNSKLNEAVTSCVAAAAAEFDPSAQKRCIYMMSIHVYIESDPTISKNTKSL